MTLVSLAFPAYYLAVSWWISVRIVIRARHQAALATELSASPTAE
jgi:hypothetical protein